MTPLEDKIFKILVVDDNTKNIQVIGNIIKDANYSMGFATDGNQALKLLKKSCDFDLVLLDIDMPILDGIQTCKQMRANPQLQHLPVIFITAFNDSDKILAGFEAGAQDYVVKPFNSKELLARMNTQLHLKYKTDQVNEMNQILEQKVAERTLDLSEANLKLSKLDKVKSNFLILITHELRTPLNGVLGISEMLRSKIKNNEFDRFLDILDESANRLLVFADSAVLFSRLKLEKYSFNFEETDLRYIIDSAIHKTIAKIKKKDITVKQEYLTTLQTITVDKDLIIYSAKSIIDNACKYCTNGGEILIKLNCTDNNLVISFSDNGKGFSEESLHELFQLFTAADVMNHSEGVGLSLATVKLIMELHKGRIEVKNNKVGAEVSLFIPL